MGTYRRIEHPLFQAYDSNGDPLNGGLVYTYAAGTTTEKATYQEDDTENANPVVLDSTGRAEIYGTGYYKFILKTSAGVEIWSLDNIAGIGETSITDIGDWAGDFDAAITDIAATETTLYVDSAATMSASVSVPSTCTVIIQKGGSIDMDGNALTFAGPVIFQGGLIDQGAAALTFNGPVTMQGGSITNDGDLNINSAFDAGPYQVFTSTGTVTLTNEAGCGVMPQWWYSGTGYWTTAIQAAIDSVATDGGEVVLPPRDYEIDDTLIMENNGLLFRGIGGIGSSHPANTETNRGATIINKSGDSDAIKIGKNETYVSDIVLKDFALDGDSATATDGNGIVLDSFGYDPSGVQNISMYNLSIHHVSHYGIYLKGNVFESSFYNLHLRHNEYGVYADATSGNCTEITFFGCHFFYSTEYGFYKGTSVTNINFYGCHFVSNGYGVYTTAYGVISGCRFEANTTTGIVVHGIGTYIFGCEVDTSTTGISVANATDCIIWGCFFASNTTDINIGSPAYNLILGGLHEQDDSLVITNASRSTQFLDANYEILTAAGACHTYGITEITSAAGAMAITLANGTATGQRKTFHFITDGGDVTLTVAQHETSNPEVFTFATAGNYLVLEWAYTKWVTMKNFGVSV